MKQTIVSWILVTIFGLMVVGASCLCGMLVGKLAFENATNAKISQLEQALVEKDIYYQQVIKKLKEKGGEL